QSTLNTWFIIAQIIKALVRLKLLSSVIACNNSISDFLLILFGMSYFRYQLLLWLMISIVLAELGFFE
ncbi:MAG: hypothetical protein ACPGRP_06350, partial [Flavobacteriaceae bacterium]